MLVVPACKAASHVDIDLPKGADRDWSGSWFLVEFGRKDSVHVAQLVQSIAADGTPAAGRHRVVADIPPGKDATSSRRFRLEAVKPHGVKFRFDDASDKSLRLSDGPKPVLVYNHGTITNERVPVKDGRRSRACYVHPLYGLDGEVLTDDFPKDHYHHHGIFWTWPHVEIEGKQYDLWMNKGIRPEFVRWLGRETGPVAAVLGVENGWFVGEKKVMIERVWLRVGKAVGVERPLDLDFTWIPVDRPITLRGAEGKSYGGLTVRFAVRDEKSATITVPNGIASKDLPETPLPWCDLTAKFAGAAAPSGAAIFIPLNHPDYPPTWLTRHYGPLCVGWPGVHGKKFEPGKPIRLSYRIWIHRGTANLQQLKEAYQAYTARVAWEK